MSVYLVFLVHIQFNMSSIKNVFSSTVFQRCLLIGTSPAQTWPGKGLFSGKWDLLHGNRQRISATCPLWVYRRGSFPWCTYSTDLSTSPVHCAAISSPWPVVCYVGLWSKRESGILFEVDSCNLPWQVLVLSLTSVTFLWCMECRQPCGYTEIVEVDSLHVGGVQERRWHKIVLHPDIL